MNINEQFEAQQELIKQLKANSAALRGALDFMMQRPYDEDDYINMIRQCNEILDLTPEQCLNSVKAEAYEQGFRYSCAVYNGGSSEQVIEVAVDSYKDELGAHNDKSQT